MEIKQVDKSGLTEIKELLLSYHLPVEDLEEAGVKIFKWREKDRLVGCIGLEKYSKHALLRSLAVHPDFTGKGIGKEITGWLLQESKNRGVKEMYLLTETAEAFFESLSFEVVKREDIPEPVKQSREFSELCPTSAIAMMKKI